MRVEPTRIRFVAPQSLQPLPPCEGPTESPPYGRVPSPSHADNPILNVQPSELFEMNFCCLLSHQSLVSY